MTKRVCDVAIIGAGTAGLKAYKAATERGADVVLIERGPGGSTCTRFGCMPSKLLIAAGRAAAGARSASIFGVTVGTIDVDGERVLRRMRDERDRFLASVLSDYHAIPDDHRIQGEARFVSSTTMTVGDSLIEAGAIIIATGARPVVPDSLKPVAAMVRTHETIFDIDVLPKRLAVLGAGALGLELAQAFARLGVVVTVLEEGDAIGGMGDPEAQAAAITAIGAEVRCNWA